MSSSGRIRVHITRHCCCSIVVPGPHIDTFAASLRSAGYSLKAIRLFVSAAVHLLGFADQQAVELPSFDEATLARFRGHLPRCPCPRRRGRLSRKIVRGTALFLVHLRTRGAARKAPPTEPAFGPASERFRDWLARHRGLAPRTLLGYQRALVPFFDTLGEDPVAYKPALLRAFVVEHLRRRGHRDVKGSITAIRAYLRFLVAEGHVPAGLAAAVPTVPYWRLSSLPRYLVPSDVERVISAASVATKKGRRDRAILLLLCRLGLRAGDVVAMTAADVDFTQGTLRVRGKGRREALLPLPQDVGDALLLYLSLSPPKTPGDRIFLTVRAPIRSFSTAAVARTVDQALTRAGLHDVPSRGAHLLRHSAATAMLRAGSTLDAIGAVLRHRSPDSTALYAKVDLRMLGRVAQAWPAGAASC